jgi:hypothetical protein
MTGPRTPKKRGRFPVNKRRKRYSSSFLTKGIDEINDEIKKAYSEVTGLDKLWETYEKIKRFDAETCFQKQKGRCAYCDKPLRYLGRMSNDAARLSFYVPLNIGGEARPDNLIVVCSQCKHNYRSMRILREDIVGIDSFADHCEALFLAIKDGASEEVRNQIKNRLNHRLADVAMCMRYVVTGDWIPETFEKIVDEENTIGEKLEDMGRGKDMKKSITEDVKQIIVTKQYKIIRNTNDER